MSIETKACSLTEAEIEELIEWHGMHISSNFSDRIERLGYLHKRLKAFQEEAKPEAKPEAGTAPALNAIPGPAKWGA